METYSFGLFAKGENMKSYLLAFSLLIAAPLCAEPKILAFAGSTRSESLNKKIVKQAADMARSMGATVTVIDLKDFPMPFYDQDLEQSQGMPANAKKLRDLIVKSDALIIASPEYNASVSGVLKNAIDWASRTEDHKFSKVPFQGKKVAIMSASPGRAGGVRGLGHLKAIIEDVGGVVLPYQLSVANAYTALNEKGELKDPSLKTYLQQEMQQLVSVQKR